MKASSTEPVTTIRRANGTELIFRVIDKMPSDVGRRERPSESLRAYLAAKESSTGMIEIKGEPAEMLRFYRSMAQWRTRHSELGVNLKKKGSRVFVWLNEPEH